MTRTLRFLAVLTALAAVSCAHKSSIAPAPIPTPRSQANPVRTIRGIEETDLVGGTFIHTNAPRLRVSENEIVAGSAKGDPNLAKRKKAYTGKDPARN